MYVECIKAGRSRGGIDSIFVNIVRPFANPVMGELLDLFNVPFVDDGPWIQAILT
jgi:hypothetical protein